MIPCILLILLLILPGCTTEFNPATRQQENIMYDVEKEQKIGEAIAQKFNEEYKMVDDVDINERVEAILDRLVEICDRKELIYTIRVIDEPELNAVSLPGGYIYVYRGVIDKADNDDQIAGVIAHEIGHIAAKHSMKRLQNMYGYTFLKVLSVASGSYNVARGVDAAFSVIFMEHSQADEFLSDELSVKYMRLAGYDPQQMANFLGKIKEEEAKAPRRQFGYFRTHPFIPQRIAAVNRVIKGSMDFRDYLNLTGEENEFVR